MFSHIIILPGFDKTGNKETFEPLRLSPGDTVSVVGPTGSGKTALISDIELLAQGDTSTGRYILLDGQAPPDEIRFDPARKPIAMITQNTKCFADLTVEDFLRLHARAREINNEAAVAETIALANKFTGEKLKNDSRVTLLSGGQTRSLLIADAILIGAAPVILLDEIENAGIFKQEVVSLIQEAGKMVIFVTHDPVIALLTHKRIIMQNGGVRKIMRQNEAEIAAAENLLELDRRVGVIRERLRDGQRITRELANMGIA